MITVFYDRNNPAAEAASKIIAFKSGAVRKRVSGLRGFQAGSDDIIVFALGVSSGHITGLKAVLSCWENIRFAKIVFVLAGNLPCGHPVYETIYSKDLPPAVRERAYCHSVDLHEFCTSAFIQKITAGLKLMVPFIRASLESRFASVFEAVSLLK